MATIATQRESKGGRSRKARKQQQKVRVKLPGIESYEKELEFSAEGPGRVVVRLERLMGSNRIRITDPKYLATLVERLEAEEAQSWVSRSFLRRKAEKNRSRQLAIEGLMEPTSDMQDLWNHPVFRVNRVLNRLAAFDHNMSHAAGTYTKVPPIHPVEPFSEDTSGSVFKGYPGHRVFSKDEPLYDLVDLQPQTSMTRLSVASPQKARPSTQPRASAASSSKSQALAQKAKEESGEEDEEDVEEEEDEDGLEEEAAQDEGEEEEADEEDEDDQVKGPLNSLQEMQKRYGVSLSENLKRDWQDYRSQLVETVFEDHGGTLADLYDLADEVVGVYSRQQETTEDFLISRVRQIQEEEDKVLAALNPDSLRAGNEGAVEPVEGGSEEDDEEGAEKIDDTKVDNTDGEGEAEENDDEEADVDHADEEGAVENDADIEEENYDNGGDE